MVPIMCFILGGATFWGLWALTQEPKDKVNGRSFTKGEVGADEAAARIGCDLSEIPDLGALAERLRQLADAPNAPCGMAHIAYKLEDAAMWVDRATGAAEGYERY